jgi:PAS domain S-box-containing protein
MRVSLPRLRTRLVPPSSAPALRYFVAVLSTTLALIPALLLSDVFESRLVVFAVAVMVSAWYGGWKPGLVATTFAVLVSAWFSLTGMHSPTEYRRSLIHLALFVFVALLICSFNAALRSAQEGMRRSEINFRSLVTNAPYGICRIALDGTLLDINPAFAGLVAYGPNELLGRNMGTLYSDPRQWSQFSSHLLSVREFRGLEADWMRKDGSTTAVRLSGRALEEEREETTFELFAEDVTERRALEQQLRQAQKMEAIGRLAGGIAHDFNNLLMVISGYSEFLMERAGSNELLRGPAREIGTAADRATALTRQLLAFSRKQMLAPRVLDLNAVVTENLKMLNRLIGEDIELVMIPGAEFAAIKADSGQIEQVILNLAVNARDAMPRGGRLTIETANVTLDESYARYHPPLKPGEYVLLALSDTGYGMDAETQTHIFEPFFTTKGTRGTGLGLSTVYGIVKQSGGYIYVNSEVQGGTTFKVYLPCAGEESEPVSVEPYRDINVLPRAVGTILLVEDEANLRRLSLESLQRQGYTVLEAEDGAAALQLAAHHSGIIHLLLTDVVMPGMNGRELARRVANIRPNVKILYMSGYTENVIDRNGTIDPGVELLQKPFSMSELISKIRELLGATSGAIETSAFQTNAQPSPSVELLKVESHTKEKLMPSRAQRFRLNLPLRYRIAGQPVWRKGTTRDISRSGLLFEAEEALKPTDRLEINLVLPVEIGGLSATEVFCKGEVVRAIGSPESAATPALAAKILQYHFHHGSSHAAEA